MESYKLVKIVGGIVILIGFVSLLSNTIYYNDTSRTFLELAFKAAILVVGFAIYKIGDRMGRNRQQ